MQDELELAVDSISSAMTPPATVLDSGMYNTIVSFHCHLEAWN